jgi:hypothetical protein
MLPFLMWIVFGNELKTERVPNGARVERHCGLCGETAVFYERTAVTKLSLYFIELLEYGKRRVMACGACGALYATDELGAALPSSGAGKVIAAAEQAGTQISTAAKDAFGKLSSAARSGLEQLGVGTPAATPPRRQEPVDDPLLSDEEALEAKFRDLEKKYRIGD